MNQAGMHSRTAPDKWALLLLLTCSLIFSLVSQVEAKPNRGDSVQDVTLTKAREVAGRAAPKLLPAPGLRHEPNFSLTKHERISDLSYSNIQVAPCKRYIPYSRRCTFQYDQKEAVHNMVPEPGAEYTIPPEFSSGSFCTHTVKILEVRVLQANEVKSALRRFGTRIGTYSWGSATPTFDQKPSGQKAVLFKYKKGSALMVVDYTSRRGSYEFAC